MCLSEETHGIVGLFRKDFEASAVNQVWKDSENIDYCNNFLISKVDLHFNWNVTQ